MFIELTFFWIGVGGWLKNKILITYYIAYQLTVNAGG